MIATNLAAFAVAKNQNSSWAARRARSIAAAAGRFDRADAKAGYRFVDQGAASHPRLPALFGLDREVFRRRPDHAPFAVVAQRLLGDLDGAAEIENFFTSSFDK